MGDIAGAGTDVIPVRGLRELDSIRHTIIVVQQQLLSCRTMDSILRTGCRSLGV